MYTSPVSLLLGFHGCDQEIGEQVLQGKIRHLLKSENQYDWLGHGVYFWENNPSRAMQFARELCDKPRPNKPRIKSPFVLGAVIDPGNCLNLLESESLEFVRLAFDALLENFDAAGAALPTNKPDPLSGELLRRDLDCAVIETLHAHHRRKGLHPYDTVRGMFPEGNELYPGAGFREKSHIQICVRNVASIKGYFRLLPES